MKEPSQKQQAIAEQRIIEKDYEQRIAPILNQIPMVDQAALAHRQKEQIMAIKTAALAINEMETAFGTVEIDKKQWLALESAINRAEPAGYSCVTRTVIPV